MTLIGDCKDKDVILIDDMVDTAGTITKAASLMLRMAPDLSERSALML